MVLVCAWCVCSQELETASLTWKDITWIRLSLRTRTCTVTHSTLLNPRKNTRVVISPPGPAGVPLDTKEFLRRAYPFFFVDGALGYEARGC